jgi:hypothetical protein
MARDLCPLQAQVSKGALTESDILSTPVSRGGTMAALAFLLHI